MWKFSGNIRRSFHKDVSYCGDFPKFIQFLANSQQCLKESSWLTSFKHTRRYSCPIDRGISYFVLIHLAVNTYVWDGRFRAVVWIKGSSFLFYWPSGDECSSTRHIQLICRHKSKIHHFSDIYFLIVMEWNLPVSQEFSALCSICGWLERFPTTKARVSANKIHAHSKRIAYKCLHFRSRRLWIQFTFTWTPASIYVCRQAHSERNKSNECMVIKVAMMGLVWFNSVRRTGQSTLLKHHKWRINSKVW